MSVEVRMRRVAEREYEDAVEWCEARRAGLVLRWQSRIRFRKLPSSPTDFPRHGRRLEKRL